MSNVSSSFLIGFHEQANGAVDLLADAVQNASLSVESLAFAKRGLADSIQNMGIHLFHCYKYHSSVSVSH